MAFRRPKKYNNRVPRAPRAPRSSYIDFERLVHEKFISVTRSLPGELFKYNVLAGIVLEEEDHVKVVALATGPRCSEKRGCSGLGAHRCHAETLVQRCLMNFFFNELKLAADSKESKFVKVDPKGGVFAFRERHYLHLYISSFSCGGGDGREMDRGQLLPLVFNRTLLKWSVAGIQGSVLAKFIRPMANFRLRTVLVGDRSYSKAEVNSKEIGMEIKRLHGPLPRYYDQAEFVPFIVALRAEGRRVPAALEPIVHRLAWYEGIEKVEVLYSDADELPLDEDSLPRLSKRALFKRLFQLATEKGWDLPANYVEATVFSEDYQTTKKELKRALGKGNICNWIRNNPGSSLGKIVDLKREPESKKKRERPDKLPDILRKVMPSGSFRFLRDVSKSNDGQNVFETLIKLNGKKFWAKGESATQADNIAALKALDHVLPNNRSRYLIEKRAYIEEKMNNYRKRFGAQLGVQEPSTASKEPLAQVEAKNVSKIQLKFEKRIELKEESNTFKKGFPVFTFSAKIEGDEKIFYGSSITKEAAKLIAFNEAVLGFYAKKKAVLDTEGASTKELQGNQIDLGTKPDNIELSNGNSNNSEERKETAV